MDAAGTPAATPAGDPAGTPAGDPVRDAPGPTAGPRSDTAPEPPVAHPGTGAAGRLTGTDAVKAHLTLVLGLALCVAAFWFELGRALSGNGLSWAYVFEWPLFAAFAVYMWWSVIHGDRAVRRRRPPRPGPVLDPRYAGMLEAWQAHQRELQASQAEDEPSDGATAGGPDA